MTIFYGGTEKQVRQQLGCTHNWHGPCVDETSKYFKCIICLELLTSNVPHLERKSPLPAKRTRKTIKGVRKKQSPKGVVYPSGPLSCAYVDALYNAFLDQPFLPAAG
jgi:hypothetical protein